MQVGACSHVGNVREINEDAYFISNDEFKLFIVADGMGGHNAGEVASNIAIDSIVSYIEENKDRLSECEDEAVDILREAIITANRNIFIKSQNESACHGMGTTLTLALILSKVYIGHVGDSRAYIVRNGEISQITRDHSLVGELLRNGNITEEEAKVHPQKNMITRAVGTEEDIKMDSYSLDFEKEDMIVLCTDGLSNLIENSEMRNILSGSKDLNLACKHLIELANERGGNDNITVIAIRNSERKER
ncbi:Stp1/IreP family PP2C-type Ser/Thr phosphatase [Lutibacter sp. B2]|nr:Stp1/IreP family PP2C-type Ser/Thr phosphatase [Lutibacter sp. B2]